MAHAGSEDGRSTQRNHVITGAGSALGGWIGFLIGALLPGGLATAALAALAGVGAGAFVGRSVAGGSASAGPKRGERSYVGLHTPDDDTTAEVM
jgi:hypothetical protein